MSATVPVRSASAIGAAYGPDRVESGPRAEPLRVLTFLNSLAPGGVERVALRLHAAWLEAGVESRVVLADGSGTAAVMPDNLHVLGDRKHPFRRFLTLLTGLPRVIDEHRPDVLFCAGNTYAGVAVCLKLLLRRRCPVIVAKISNDLVRADMSPLMRWWYRRWLWLQGRTIDRFVGMAPAMQPEIAVLIGVPAHRISIIEDPALTDAERLHLAAARASTCRTRAGRHFVAAGRLVPQKNFALLVDAFARIARPDDTLTILGEGCERATLEAQVAGLGLGHAVALPGHVASLDRWLAEADALVLSSDYEGVPAVLIEALAAGLPIVATNCCVSMADLLGEGSLGRIVPAGDAAALAAAMGATTNGASTECASTIAARQSAAARFTIERATDHYIAAMRQPALAQPDTTPAINRGEPIQALTV